MNRIETNNFILTQELVESDGESTWLVTEPKSNEMFYIHVLTNNRLNIKIFNETRFSSDASEAITALCFFLIDETQINPTINIYYKNKHLILLCVKAGFRKKKNIKHLYIFKAQKAKRT